MKQAFLNHSIKWITTYNPSYGEEEIEKLKYGLEGLYLTITKLVIIFLLSILLGIFKEMLIVLVLFNIIRYPAFGFHANNSVTCLLFSAVLFIGLPYLMTHIQLTLFTKLLLCGICLLHYIIFAPADTPKRPLTNVKKRQIRKLASIAIAIIYILVIVFLKENSLSQLILTALIIESIMINPLTYKLFHQSFHNYKMYTSK